MSKILIVDDHTQSLYLSKSVLGAHGHQVIAAANGLEALERARSDPPDMIISDILMPVMDGFSLCREWRQDQQLRNIPFVFYTATYTEPKDEELALRLGAARFIVKPVEPDEFIALIERVIAEAELGLLTEPPQSSPEETTYYRMYNETLIRKLEDKMLELEKVNRKLEQEIFQRKQAEEKIQGQLQQLRALRAIDIAIAGSLDLRVILDTVLQHVTVQLGAHACAILLFNPHMQTIEYAASQGFHSTALPRAPLKLSEGFAGQALFKRQIIHIPDLMSSGNQLLRALVWSQADFVDYYGAPLIVKGDVKGLLEILHQGPLETGPEWMNYLETLAGQAAIAIDNIQLFNSLQRANIDLTMAYDATIAGWSRALDLRDRETEGHTQRVTDLTLKLARAMDIGESQMTHIRRGSLLHDIGKMGVPDNILLKPDKLTTEEWEKMRKHPEFAYDLLSPIRYLQPALDIPYCHHEKWDGSGYPRGLKGEQIPLAARVFAVVDVRDALTSDRPYRQAWNRNQALDHIREQSGKYFDPQVVRAFLNLLREEVGTL